MLHQPLRNREEWVEISKNRDQEKTVRLIERRAPFFQSSTLVNVRYSEHDSRTRWARRYIIFRDWFDYLLSFRTSIVIFFLIIAYTLQLFVWTGFYMSIDCEESNPPLTAHEAFAFALQTATTVGFRALILDFLMMTWTNESDLTIG